MEWIPRHPQPFTWAELVALSVPEITQEIARLQHSLVQLHRTQDELKQHVEASPDVEISDAIKENNGVIASQTERIQMMRLALQVKGFTQASNPHYDVPIQERLAGMNANQQAAAAVAGPTSDSSEDGGVYL